MLFRSYPLLVGHLRWMQVRNYQQWIDTYRWKKGKSCPVVLCEAPKNGKKRKGFNTGKTTKLVACAKFKTLLESKKMKLNSHSLISELKTFVAVGGSYQAKSGETDDLVMGTLLVVRILQQLTDFHYDLEEQIRDHDETILPLPFYAIL